MAPLPSLAEIESGGDAGLVSADAVQASQIGAQQRAGREEETGWDPGGTRGRLRLPACQLTLLFLALECVS